MPAQVEVPEIVTDIPPKGQPLQPTQERDIPDLKRRAQLSGLIRWQGEPAALTRGCWFSENLPRSKCQMSQCPTLAHSFRGDPRKVLKRKALAPVHSSTSVFITGCQAVSSTSLHQASCMLIFVQQSHCTLYTHVGQQPHCAGDALDAAACHKGPQKSSYRHVCALQHIGMCRQVWVQRSH